MKKTYFTIILILLFVSNLWAANTIYLPGNNSDYKCSFRPALLKTISHKENFAYELKNINFSPECLDKDQTFFINNTKKDVSGFFFGAHYATSNVLGIEGGFELVITVYDDKTLMIGVVSFAGASASISLPVGASITKGVLYGDCDNITNYLGHFQNISMAGMNASYGSKNELSNFEYTGCNSVSSTKGFSVSLLGYSVSDYQKYSNFYFLKGERVHDLIEFITRHHPLKQH
jgi:hypothetical protein